MVHKPDPRMQITTRHQPLDVSGDGLGTNAEFACDRFVALSLCKQGEDIFLALGPGHGIVMKPLIVRGAMDSGQERLG